MAPPMYDAGGSPPSTFLAPTTDNQAIPQRKSAQHIPPSQGSHARHKNEPAAISRKLRPLSVNEALQYSPLSSIVPFNSGVIPFPTPGLPTSQPIMLNQFEQQATQQGLDSVNRDLTNGQGKLAQHALATLKPMLHSENITEFKFKIPPGFRSQLPDRASTKLTKSQTLSPNRLGLFANMVLNATNVSFTYPSPTSSSPSSMSSQLEGLPEVELQRLPVTPISPQHYLHNTVAYSQNNTLSVNDGSSSTPQRAKLHPVVVIPPLPQSSQPSEYKTFPDQRTPEATNGDIPRKRQHDRVEETGESMTRARDLKALSTEALSSLSGLLQEIFTAEDLGTAYVSRGTSTEVSKPLFSCHGEDGDSLNLTPASHTRLESCLQKTISLGRFAEVSIDHLLRLQKLCESTLISAGSVDVTIGSGWDEGEASRWLERVDVVDLGLRSARTSLRIMSGGREEKQIYSEELFQRVMDVLRKAMDSCIIPAVESRTTNSTSELFILASAHKKTLSQLTHCVNKALLLISELLTKVELAESTVTSLEFFLARLLFVENAHSEKESVLGIHKFEAVRRMAMDIVAEIFSRYPEQRTFLLDEILSSLQKLPVTRQHARQFKLSNGKSIQLVSALIMRLVQTSGMHSVSNPARKPKRTLPEHDSQKPSDSSESNAEDIENGDEGRRAVRQDSLETEGSEIASENFTGARATIALQRLSMDAKSYYSSATGSAQHVVRFFVHRASSASKTGEQPHRHLLDIFSEDLILVLSLPEWPGAQLLLRALLSEMLRIVQNTKSTAPTKNMALESLGLMGSAISDLVAESRQLARNLENDEAQITSFLLQLVDDHMTGHLDTNELLGWSGPFRVVLDYLYAQGSESLQNTSAQGYLLTQWAKSYCFGNGPTSELDIDEVNGQRSMALTGRLGKMLLAGKWSITDDFEAISVSQSRLAYALIILNLDFCQAFNHILKILLDSISSDHTTTRSRSLKSVTQMLEKDPTLLDRAPIVIKLINKCATDSSPMVRDSALCLIGKCMILKPVLEDEIYKLVVANTSDSAVGVRKRSMKLLKDIYLRNSRKDIKSTIADSILQRSRDTDETVSDLARHTFEDIWLSPFFVPSSSRSESVQVTIALKEQVSLIIGTVQRGESVTSVLDDLLHQIMSKKSKNAAENYIVCKLFVAAAFEGIIDPNDLPGRPEQQHILQALTLFAKANPKLFDAQQLQHLQPYVGNLSSSDDLNLFRSVVVILRCVLPKLPTMQQDFLKAIQADLLKSVGKLGKSELNEVVACLWSINSKLGNIERLVTLTVGVLKNLRSSEELDFEIPGSENDLLRIKRYIRIAGYFGKHCDFEPQIHTFRQQLSWFDGDSVAGFIVASMQPYAASKQPITLQASTLDAIGLVCQAWPRQFNRVDVTQKFRSILGGNHSDLQKIVLASFRDFFAAQDRPVEGGIVNGTEEAGPSANGKLGGSMTATDNDGAAALIAQGFLKEILRIALTSQDEYALIATQVIASINRQGLVHPKECGPALVALETSTNSVIADLAFQEHCNLHQQHESMFEREYMRAIHEAFVYQRDVVHHSLGAVGQPYAAKLHLLFEIIKMSKGKYQKKFLSNLCAKIDFDIAKLDTTASPPAHLEYARFLTENLLFFDYARLDELYHTIFCIERIVASTGAGIAHSINAELLRVVMEGEAKNPSNSNDLLIPESKVNETVALTIKDNCIRQLTTASMILSALWEARTFLRRLYGLGSSQQRQDNKAKPSTKDLSKAPFKNQGITGDRAMDAIAKISRALDSSELMLEQCKQFATLLSIDDEVKIYSGEDTESGRNETPSVGDDDEDNTLQGSDGLRTVKRKSSLSITGTPHKRKKGRPSLGKRRKSGRSIGNEDDFY